MTRPRGEFSISVFRSLTHTPIPILALQDAQISDVSEIAQQPRKPRIDFAREGFLNLITCIMYDEPLIVSEPPMTEWTVYWISS